MKTYIQTFDNLPLIVKIILALPALDILWNVYRLFKSIESNDILGMAIAAVLIVAGWWFVPVIDIICLVLLGRIWWMD